MKTQKYKELIKFIQDNEIMICSDIIKTTSSKAYFEQFSANGLIPGEVVTNTFINVLKLSLQLGDTEELKKQYVWTVRMLGSRGMEKSAFIQSFCAYMSSTQEAIEKHICDKEYMALNKEFFTALIEEFVFTANSHE